ncbi:MAG: hypothetical protein JWQ79_858 [Mucilaginibacter sp.]|jgi:hypothetical protein|nr:hypothetical protein [Mucilaginibacter sp.]
MLWGVGLFSLLLIFSYSEIITNNSDYRDWLFFGAISILIGSRFIYLSIMYYIPCFNDKPALILDKEKLQCFITGKLLFQVAPDIIYWKDLADIDYNYAYRKGGLITFKMKNGNDDNHIYIKYNPGGDSGMYTQYISGNSKTIYRTITEYFDKYK